MADNRTAAEREKGYPPSESTIIRRCTVPIVGVPNRYLFTQVEREIVDYVTAAGRTVDDVMATFRDTTGSFTGPSLQDAGPGRWLRHFGLYPDRAAAQRLLDAAPASWLDILRVRDIGPDTFYDMFAIMARRWVRSQGECLGVFIGPDGHPVDREYFAIEPGPDLPQRVFVRVREGLPIDVANGNLFVFPALGEYTVSAARPSVPFADERTTYPTADLTGSATARVRIRTVVAEPIMRIGVAANSLRVFYDPGIRQLSVHPARNTYPAKHLVLDAGSPQERDKNGTPCGSCSKFAYIAQEELEDSPIRTVTLDPNRSSVVLRDLPAGRHVVAGYTDAGTVVTTVRDVMMDARTVLEIGLDHTFDLSRLEVDPPRKAFLQGDIIRQHQKDTQWCGPYSLAHAFSYWNPVVYNPKANNGKWAGETIRDQPTTWLHLTLGFLTLGLSHLVTSIFTDDPSPGTLQETLVRGCHAFGFSSQGLTYKSLGKSAALKELKRWIHAGIPVIVTVDEKMDQGDGHWSSEHYKTIVGYDDDAPLRYTDDDGNEHTSTGAFYFINSGGMGETRSDPEVLSPERRETHTDYHRVPIGNDADSYTVFWRKWQTGSIPTFSKSHWCIPVFPVNFERVYVEPT